MRHDESPAMAAPDVENLGVPRAKAFSHVLQELLDEASALKPASPDTTSTSSIEPPINKHDLSNLSDRISSVFPPISAEAGEEDEAVKKQRSRNFAAIEAVARDFFSRLTASTPITSPEFVNMWNFLDVLSILSDDGHCEPALLFWLIEELLDSQTIAGCRIIFDYLESRRERITAKHFKQTNLVILRSCNELLRRLSRAEDTAFCGRVFIFLFQSFPLGDRSSVNLRGEYHVENVTTFEQPTEEESKMDVDTQEEDQTETPEGKTDEKGAAKKADEPLSFEELYGIFWPLQESFSQPLTLFDATHFKKFQRGVDETVKKFKTYPSDEGARSASTLEEPKQTLKRKRDGTTNDEPSEAFNPKYLTSKDLFELEVGDLTFRRHIFVQILIVMNFILSWTPEAKKKYEKMNASNKSVMYSGEFNEEDVKWAREIKYRIADYLRRDQPGRLFHRMIDTVLARDKNWVYWKMAGCEPIRCDPVSAELWADAQASAQRATTNKRLRPVPLNAVSMDFLKEKDSSKIMEELKDPARYKVPDLDTFKAKIADDDFDMSMAANDAEKVRISAMKASKSWRALRIARGFKLAAFDKIDDPTDISAIFKPLDELEAEQEGEDVASEEDMPTNRETVIICGPTGVGKTVLVEKLFEAHKGVFGRVVRHTTRDPVDGESNGKDFHFVKPLEFNQLRDGDRLVEYTEQGEVAYGTSSKAIDAVTESGKVAIIEMDVEAAKFAKDMMDFPGRYIFIQPPDQSILEARLKESSKHDEASIKFIIETLPEHLDTKTTELFDTIVTNGDLEEAAKTIGEYIYKKNDDKGGEDEQEDKDDEDEGNQGENDKPEETQSETVNGEDKMEVDANAES